MDFFSSLPEGCIAHIVSFTSPLDACRSSAVSSRFLSASESDVVWDKFLPSDYMEIVSRSVSPVEFRSLKELYFRLCDRPTLIDQGKMSFNLHKPTGKRCYMLAARELSIAWKDTPMYWQQVSLPKSRFSEVARLVSVCWLDIKGKIESKILSPRSTYIAYLVLNVTYDAYGLASYPVKLSLLQGGNQVSGYEGFLPSNGLPNPQLVEATLSAGNSRLTQPRQDGWREIELGEFYNEGDEGEVEMCCREVEGLNWKGGLIIEGIEIRPK